MTTLLALDVDGVLNAFSKSPKLDGRGVVHSLVDDRDYKVSWRVELLERLKGFLSRPDVEGAWLTTWLEQPAMLNELEEMLGLVGLVPVHAEIPLVVSGWGKVVNPAFDSQVSSSSSSPRWWKYRAWELLRERGGYSRAAWLDDDLGRAKGVPNMAYKPSESFETLLLKTHEQAGMLSADLDKLELWLDRAS